MHGGRECVGAGGGCVGACLGVRAGAAAQQQKGQRAGKESTGASPTLLDCALQTRNPFFLGEGQGAPCKDVGGCEFGGGVQRCLGG